MAVDNEEDMMKKLEELRQANNEMANNDRDNGVEHKAAELAALQDNNDNDKFGGLRGAATKKIQ
jgi:hypothetical protein